MSEVKTCTHSSVLLYSARKCILCGFRKETNNTRPHCQPFYSLLYYGYFLLFPRVCKIFILINIFLSHVVLKLHCNLQERSSSISSFCVNIDMLNKIHSRYKYYAQTPLEQNHVLILLVDARIFFFEYPTSTFKSLFSCLFIELYT